jgi:hypothetical protein
MRQNSGAFVDQDFSLDHTVRDREIGVALRLPNSGLLGKGRYYVIVARDRRGQLLETFYEGPGGYPDVPPRPLFVGADSVTARMKSQGRGEWALGSIVAATFGAGLVRRIP